MAPLLLYATCAIGAVGLYLILRPGPRPVRAAGTLIGLAALAYLAVGAVRAVAGSSAGTGGAGGTIWPGDASPIFYGLFGLIAVAGAVRMVTHPRPVYAALYFVLVVIASAGLFLLMQAEFMAFALVIVYAGAILITYLFVLMLAQQAQSEQDLRTLAEYDAVPREPGTAVLVGLIMVAVLGDALFGTRHGVPAVGQPIPAANVIAASDDAWRELDLIPRARDRAVRLIVPDAKEILTNDLGKAIELRRGVAFVRVVDGTGATREVELPASALPGNTQRVGLALVADFPVSLELAGVILTMAMFGAVILARRQAEFGEDQRREAAGLRRYTVNDDDRDEDPSMEARP